MVHFVHGLHHLVCPGALRFPHLLDLLPAFRTPAYSESAQLCQIKSGWLIGNSLLLQPQILNSGTGSELGTRGPH